MPCPTCVASPIHWGPSTTGKTYQLAETGGVEDVTLTTQQLPNHTHSVRTTAVGQTVSPQGAIPATVASSQAGANAYAATTPNVALAPQSISAAGGSQPHTNFHPYLCLNHIISLFGIFPSPT